MMITRSRTGRALMSVLATWTSWFVVPREAHAEALPEQLQSDARSRIDVVGRQTVELLRWLPGPGRDVARSSVARRLGLDTGTARDLSRTADEHILIGADWKLTVAADGTRVRFRRDTNVPGRTARIEADDLTRLGLEVIGGPLADVVAIGPGEELVPLRTRYERAGGQAEGATAPIPDMVLSNEIVFGRKVDGIRVVGVGSRLVITFNSDGSLQACDVDWPRVARTERLQTVASQDTVWSRAARFSVARGDEAVDLRRMECGYVDVGARRRTGAPIQVGCALAYRMTRQDADGDALTHAQVSVVPAGVLVEPDPAWPEARRLCSGSPICGTAPPPGTRPPSRPVGR